MLIGLQFRLIMKDSGFTIGKSVPANAIFTDTVYTHPTTTATTAAAVKVGKDSLGHVVIGETITAADIGAAASGHGHSNATKTAAGFMSAADKTKLEGIADNANNYSHPTTSGNKHIPSGGSAGQFLKWSADGTAVWAADNNTTYSAVGTTGNPGLMTAADKVKLDGIDKNANKITVDSALSSSSTNPVQNKAINTALEGKANTSHTHTYVYIGTTAPSDTKLLWVDTANGLKYHNGSAWVVVPVAYS